MGNKEIKFHTLVNGGISFPTLTPKDLGLTIGQKVKIVCGGLAGEIVTLEQINCAMPNVKKRNGNTIYIVMNNLFYNTRFNIGDKVFDYKGNELIIKDIRPSDNNKRYSYITCGINENVSSCYGSVFHEDNLYFADPTGGNNIIMTGLAEPSKTLPKYFAIEMDTLNPLWDKYISWLNKTFNQNWGGASYKYYGYNGRRDCNGTFSSHVLSPLINDPKLITLEEWNSCVNYGEEPLNILKPNPPNTIMETIIERNTLSKIEIEEFYSDKSNREAIHKLKESFVIGLERTQSAINALNIFQKKLLGMQKDIIIALDSDNIKTLQEFTPVYTERMNVFADMYAEINLLDFDTTLDKEEDDAEEFWGIK